MHSCCVRAYFVLLPTQLPPIGHSCGGDTSSVYAFLLRSFLPCVPSCSATFTRTLQMCSFQLYGEDAPPDYAFLLRSFLQCVPSSSAPCTWQLLMCSSLFCGEDTSPDNRFLLRSFLQCVLSYCVFLPLVTPHVPFPTPRWGQYSCLRIPTVILPAFFFLSRL